MPEPISINEAVLAIWSGQLDVVELVQDCLAEIARHEDRIHAWAHVDEAGALEAARNRAEAARRGEKLGPLHGIPLGIKDIMDAAGLPTRAGSPLTPDQPAAADAWLVKRLREAGAVIIGKTVTTEFAYIDPPPTRNPWAPDLARSPGGSSSGSAAAVALGMCLGATGTQTGGSLIRPASYCGVAACKPTRGRIPLDGVIPLAYHLDHGGAMARSVRDLETLMGCLIDMSEVPFPKEQGPSGVPWAACPPLPVNRERRPPRLGLLEPFFMEEAAPSVRQAVHSALLKLEACGATVEAADLPLGFDEIAVMHRRIFAAEAAAYHRPAFLAHRESYGPKLATLIEVGLAMTAADYAEALAHQRSFIRRINAHFGPFDAWIMPATDTTAPTTLATTGDAKFQLPWTYLGVPEVSLPCALAPDGMPIALQLVGRHDTDAALLRVACWCEECIGFHRRPASNSTSAVNL